ncbi:MAG: hypothetical protein LBT09_12080 [Planctomycetaceae bacterium]|nr:hypothetical protein [Planctomycetaceae bacterium]
MPFIFILQRSVNHGLPIIYFTDSSFVRLRGFVSVLFILRTGLLRKLIFAPQLKGGKSTISAKSVKGAVFKDLSENNFFYVNIHFSELRTIQF